MIQMIKRESPCERCGAPTDNTAGEFCPICDDFKSICDACTGPHLTEAHTQADFMKAMTELTQ